jgi:hypothetical protein
MPAATSPYANASVAADGSQAIGGNGITGD